MAPQLYSGSAWRRESGSDTTAPERQHAARRLADTRSLFTQYIHEWHEMLRTPGSGLGGDGPYCSSLVTPLITTAPHPVPPFPPLSHPISVQVPHTQNRYPLSRGPAETEAEHRFYPGRTDMGWAEGWGREWGGRENLLSHFHSLSKQEFQAGPI